MVEMIYFMYKKFVDLDTIKKPIATRYYLTINIYNSYDVPSLFSYGLLNINYVSTADDVRTVIYPKACSSVLTFTIVNGLPNHPMNYGKLKTKIKFILVF